MTFIFLILLGDAIDDIDIAGIFGLIVVVGIAIFYKKFMSFVHVELLPYTILFVLLVIAYTLIVNRVAHIKLISIPLAIFNCIIAGITVHLVARVIGFYGFASFGPSLIELLGGWAEGNFIFFLISLAIQLVAIIFCIVTDIFLPWLILPPIQRILANVIDSKNRKREIAKLKGV